MDERTAATINGYAAVLTEVLRVLVAKRVLSKAEVRKAVAEVLVRGVERGEPAGFDEIPMRILISIEGWIDFPASKH